MSIDQFPIGADVEDVAYYKELIESRESVLAEKNPATQRASGHK